MLIERTELNPNWFYEPIDFPELKVLEENAQVIISDLKKLIEAKVDNFWFNSYPGYVSSTTENAWKTFTFQFFTIKINRNNELCKSTSEILSKIPELITAEFSYLKPHTHIKPHRGFSREILRVHLGLIIPKECGIKVGEETRNWSEGKLLILDDSFTHEAWNNSDEERFILMLDIPNKKYGHTAKEISSYKINNMTDKFMLETLPKEKWIECFNKGNFDWMQENA